MVRASKSKSSTVNAHTSPILMPPAHAANNTLNRSDSGIDSYKAANCTPVNGGTLHDFGSGSGGIGNTNGFDSNNGMPVPNLSEQAISRIAFNR